MTRAARERFAAWMLSPEADAVDERGQCEIPEIDDDGEKVPAYKRWDNLGPVLRELSGMPRGKRCTARGPYAECMRVFGARCDAINPAVTNRGDLEVRTWERSHAWKEISNTLRSYDPQGFLDALTAARLIAAGADVDATLRAFTLTTEARPAPVWALLISTSQFHSHNINVTDLDTDEERANVMTARDGRRYYLPTPHPMLDDDSAFFRGAWRWEPDENGPAWVRLGQSMDPAAVRVVIDHLWKRIFLQVYYRLGGCVPDKDGTGRDDRQVPPQAPADDAELAAAWLRVGRIFFALFGAHGLTEIRGEMAAAGYTDRRAVDRAALRWGRATVTTGGEVN